MTLKDAWQKVKSQRPVVRPNYRFSQALLSWERDVRGENSMTIEEFCPKGPRKRNVKARKAMSALDKLNDSGTAGSGGSCSIL